MEKITVTKTIEEVTGYRAEDGTVFKTEEECKKYEDSARFVIKKQFTNLLVKNRFCDENGFFSEYQIYENFGYGSEEYDYCILELKSAEDLKIAQMYVDTFASKNKNRELTTDDIGKRLLVGVGFEFDGRGQFYIDGTMEEMIEKFTNDMKRFFYPEEMEEKGE